MENFPSLFQEVFQIYFFFIKLNSGRRFVGRVESSLSSDVDFIFFVAVELSSKFANDDGHSNCCSTSAHTQISFQLQLHACFISIKCLNACRDLEEVFGALTLSSPYFVNFNMLFFSLLLCNM